MPSRLPYPAIDADRRRRARRRHLSWIGWPRAGRRHPGLPPRPRPHDLAPDRHPTGPCASPRSTRRAATPACAARPSGWSGPSPTSRSPGRRAGGTRRHDDPAHRGPARARRDRPRLARRPPRAGALRSAAGCAPSTRPSARSGARSASRSERALDHVRRRVDADDIDPAGFHDEHRHLTPADGTGRAGGDRPRRRGPRRLPRRLLPAQRAAERRRRDRLRRPGRARRGRPLVGHRRRAHGAPAGTSGSSSSRSSTRATASTPDPARIRFYRLLYDLVS